MKKRGRPLSFDRDQALKSAMLTFWQFGFGGTSIADLTFEMEISAQSLYAAFGSKSELYHEALGFYQKNYCDPIQALLGQGGDCLSEIESMLKATACMYCDKSHPKGCMIATANLGCAAENCAEVVYVSQLRQKTILAMQKYFERGIRHKDILPQANPKLMASYLGIVMQGMSVQAQDHATLEELHAVIDMAIPMLQPYFNHVV